MDPGSAPPPPSALPADRHLVVPRVARDRAEARIWAEISEGPLRPPDARTAVRIEALHALFVPFWRVDIRRWDDAQRLKEERVGYLGVPAEQGPGEATTGWMVCATSSFPYELKSPTSMIPSDSKPILLHASALRPGDPDPSSGWEVIGADIDQRTAVDFARSSYKKLSFDAEHILAQAEIAIPMVHFVWYPMWLARYRYGAENAPTRDGLFHVGISAVDETCVLARHPSKLAAGAARIKKLFKI